MKTISSRTKTSPHSRSPKTSKYHFNHQNLENPLNSLNPPSAATLSPNPRSSTSPNQYNVFLNSALCLKYLNRVFPSHGILTNKIYSISSTHTDPKQIKSVICSVSSRYLIFFIVKNASRTHRSTKKKTQHVRINFLYGSQVLINLDWRTPV